MLALRVPVQGSVQGMGTGRTRGTWYAERVEIFLKVIGFPVTAHRYGIEKSDHHQRMHSGKC